MLKGPAFPESSFFHGEPPCDNAAASTASVVAGDARTLHFANGVGLAGTVGEDDAFHSPPSSESHKPASAYAPDGQFGVGRRRDIEEAAESVRKELGAVQMTEEGCVKAWSATANVCEQERPSPQPLPEEQHRAHFSQPLGCTTTGSRLEEPDKAALPESHLELMMGAECGVEKTAVGPCDDAARYDVASGDGLPTEFERNAGPSANASRTVEHLPEAHRWASAGIEDLPSLGGGSEGDGETRQASESGSMQRSGDYLLANRSPGNRDNSLPATPDNRSADYGHTAIPSSGATGSAPSVNTSFLENSTPSVSSNYSHVTKENSAPGIFGTNITKDQFRYCSSVIKNLKRHTNAHPFLKPVDPVALNIPDYPSIIKRPMDLGTVDDKLTKGLYADPNAFADDVRLVFHNCYLYNGRQSTYSQLAIQLESIFENQMKKMPASSALIRSPPRSIVQAKTPRTGVIRPPPSATPQATPSKPAATPRPRPSASRKSVPSARKSSGKFSPVAGADRQMRFCMAVLNELGKKQYTQIHWPFLQPVDPVALNIPDYFTVIKHPMDLSTIRRKLEGGDYSSPREFENDVNLMFDNCFTFNRAGDPVYTNGERLREVFRAKWKDLPPPPISKKSATKPSTKHASKASVTGKKSAPIPASQKAKGSGDEESEESESEEDETPALGNFEQLALMEAHMNMMQKRLEELKSAAAGTKLSKKKSRSESTPPGAKASRPGKSTKAKSASSPKKSKVESSKVGSRRKSTSKSAASVEGEWEHLAAGTATGKGKHDKKRRASQVDFTSSSEDDGNGRHPTASENKDAASSAPGTTSKPATKKAKVAAGPPVILFEHKQQLSEMINSLGEDKLETVIEIIHDSMPHLRGATEEVELDIDALDYGSFYKLYNYVVNDVRPTKKGPSGGRVRGAGKGNGNGKRVGKSGGSGSATAPDRPYGGGVGTGSGEVAPASPHSTAADATSGSSVGDAPIGGGPTPLGAEKKKYLSEEEQAQQIMALEEKLKQFTDVASAVSPEEDKVAVHQPVSESSDELVDSGDESSDGSLA